MSPRPDGARRQPGTSRGSLPLEGLLVLDVATMVMVPSAATVLADFGAEVIKIEPHAGDLNRYGHLIPGMPSHALDYCFFQDNRNKRSLSIDLKQDEGREILYRLAERADVFFTNLRHRALERLRIDWPTLRELNPRLIYAHGTGFGDRGPEVDKPGFDVVSYWSRSALELSMFPTEGWLGAIPYGSGDHPTGMSLVAAVLLALLQRERTGEGCRVTTSLLASGAWSNATIIQARLLDAQFHERRPRHDPINFAAVYYLSRDQRPFKFTIIDHDAGWPRLCRAVEREDLIDDPCFATLEARARVTGEIVSILDRRFAEHDLEHWRRAFERHDVPFSVLSTYDDVVADEQMRANGVFVEIEDERYGTVRSIDSPLAIDGLDKKPPRRAPWVGEHSREILGELGLGEREIEALIASGIVVAG